MVRQVELSLHEEVVTAVAAREAAVKAATRELQEEVACLQEQLALATAGLEDSKAAAREAELRLHQEARAPSPIGPDRIGSGRIGSDRIGSNRIGSGHIGSDRRARRSCGCTRRRDARRRGLDRIGSDRIGSDRTESAHARRRRWRRRWRAAPPR